MPRPRKLVLSPKMEGFDLDKEPQKIRDAYGSSPFGQGCLLARRLIETGVTFVEVALGNWDTHQDNFNRTPHALCGQLDQPFAALLADLKQPRHARQHARRLDGRVRPHAADQSQQRPRPLSRGPSPRSSPAAA